MTDLENMKIPSTDIVLEAETRRRNTKVRRKIGKIGKILEAVLAHQGTRSTRRTKKINDLEVLSQKKNSLIL
jgi:hypothetical protein